MAESVFSKLSDDNKMFAVDPHHLRSTPGGGGSRRLVVALQARHLLPQTPPLWHPPREFGLRPRTRNRSRRDYQEHRLFKLAETNGEVAISSSDREQVGSVLDCVWSLYDNLLFDTLYGDTEMEAAAAETPEILPEIREVEDGKPDDIAACKKRRICRSHLASGSWNLSHEQGNKLLGSRFEGDSLHICDCSGCVHVEQKRNYMVFRGYSRTSSNQEFGERSTMGAGSRLI